MLLSVFAFLLTLFATVRGQGCICSMDGISNGVPTETPGCVLDEAVATRPRCFVVSSDSCPEATPSEQFSGAAFIECSVDDALFYAAELDDVASFERFREMDLLLTVTRFVSDNRTGDEDFSLIAYAAAYGSFGVLEDLLINEDYECGVGVDLYDALCAFYGTGHCREENPERQAIQSLIDFTYGVECDRRGAQGVPTVCESYPYFVSVRSAYSTGYSHRCGGVLVASDAVLTAAHCLDGSHGESFTPVLVIGGHTRQGRGSCSSHSEIRKATQIVFHPDWTRGTYAGAVGNGKDIALIKLNLPSNHRPIRISSRTTVDVGESLYFIGMGMDSSNNGFSQELRIQEIEAADPEICQEAYPQGVASDVLCVGGDSADFCTGDDGGPLFRSSSGRDTLVGIAHLKHPSADCGTRGIPGLYSNAAMLRTWITRTRNRQF